MTVTRAVTKFHYEGRSLSSTSNCFKKITVNNNSKTVLSFFNIVSQQINRTFPAFHKSPEACDIEIFVSVVENFRTCCWIRDMREWLSVFPYPWCYSRSHPFPWQLFIPIPIFPDTTIPNLGHSHCRYWCFNK